MAIAIRRYKLLSDFERVSKLLRDSHVDGELGGNVPQPYWEYAHTHPAFEHKLTHRFGLWEDEGELVGVAFYEMGLGEAFFATAAGYAYLKPEMLDWAERELFEVEDGRRKLCAVAYDYEEELREALAARGYERAGEQSVMTFDYAAGFPDAPLPEGFRLAALAEDPDPVKMNRVLWRGFDHGDEPDDDYDCRLLMQSGPHFDPGLATVVVAPNGEWACFAGMWMDGRNPFGYLEPMATDPAYRRLGLARAALVEGMRKTAARGARYCIGGDQAFYRDLGFKRACALEYWKRSW